MSRIKVGHKDGRGIWRDEGPSNGVLRASTAIRGVLVVGYTPKPESHGGQRFKVRPDDLRGRTPETICGAQTRAGVCCRAKGHLKKSHASRDALDRQAARDRERRRAA